MKKIGFALLFVLISSVHIFACTSILVGKNASIDGSTMITYAADSYAVHGDLYYWPIAEYPKNTVMEMYDWETTQYLGPIKQVPATNNVVGYINEYQLSLGETTFGGRKELVDSTGIMDYGNLIFLALQRAKTAREAIKVMTDLVEEYGYFSSGESFSIADKNEIWIMEMIGKGVGRKGAVWVAVRIPDDCIAAHANQARIHQFPLNDPENCIYSKDVISFAREMGYYKGADKDFSFANAYSPLAWSKLRFCEARVWSIFNKFGEGDANKWLPYILGEDPTPMPLYIKPKQKVSVKDIMDMMRDQYANTPFDPTKDIGAGAYGSPYRFNPLSFEFEGKKYGFERPIATQQTAFSFVSQMRDYLPDEIGGVLWFGTDDANCSVYTPMYGSITQVPECYREGNGDLITFSWTSAFWIHNWVANMIYPRYDQLLPDLRAAQNELEGDFLTSQAAKEKEFAELLKIDRNKAIEQITNYSLETAERTMTRWKSLGEYLIVKSIDGVIKKEEIDQNGEKRFKRSIHGLYERPDRPQLNEKILRAIIQEKGDWLEQKEIKR